MHDLPAQCLMHWILPIELDAPPDLKKDRYLLGIPVAISDALATVNSQRVAKIRFACTDRCTG